MDSWPDPEGVWVCSPPVEGDVPAFEVVTYYYYSHPSYDNMETEEFE